MGRVTHYDTVQMLTYLHSYRKNVAKYWVTVTAGQTHTIQSLGVSAATVVDWGDGLSNEYTGTAMRAHVYASAGTYEVDIYTPENVTSIKLASADAVRILNSADLKTMVNVSTLYLFNLVSASITINSIDLVGLRPSDFRIAGPTSASITINSIDLAAWRLNAFQLYSIPNATITIAPSSIRNWSGLSVLDLRTGNLTQPQADLVLWECYQMQRTVVGGDIYLAIAGNAAPSGTFQPCQNPPVSATTPGKEIAYELLNDSLGIGFNKWATVTTN